MAQTRRARRERQGIKRFMAERISGADGGVVREMRRTGFVEQTSEFIGRR
jgi:hypothetical protein